MAESRGKPNIREISLEEVQNFRYRVLRPKERAHSVYQLDAVAGTRHVGAFVGDDLAGVATVCHEPIPGTCSNSTWRLRGMATAGEFRGHGIGSQLAEDCFAYARSQGGTVVWCSARLSAIGFYQAVGFEPHDESFTLPEYSSEQYVLMKHSLRTD
ncbi:MAG: GNAT family N-acetyltransferase [Candidatus Acidiferrales bacterium]